MSTLTAAPSLPHEPAPIARVPVPVIPVTAAPRPSRRHLWLLLAITLLGVLLRFSFLEKPPLWGDDAYTIYRTHADYRSMLDILQDDGFTPLHYQLYFLLARIDPILSVPIVRALPAFWGSLMPPAIYFFASFLVRRRSALAAALFAACSAYLLGYSRDGKMYMMLWTCAALSAGCLLWWFRSGRRVAWLAWVAASLATASAHMAGPGVLALQAAFFLTQRRVHWKGAILFLIGLMVALSGPVGYLTQFSRFVKDEVEDFGFEVEGLGWVVEYNQGRTGPDLLTYSAGAYLTGWEWPKAADEPRIKPWVLATFKASVVGLFLVAAIGALPWSRRLRGVVRTTPDGHEYEPDSPPESGWRTFLWLGLWLVLPAYFIYCRSVIDFVSPGTWIQTTVDTIAGAGWLSKLPQGRALWIVLGVLVVGCAVGVFLNRYARVGLVWAILAWAAVALIVSLCTFGSIKGEGAVRWIGVLGRWWDWATTANVAVPLVILLPGLIVYYSGRTLTERITRVVGFVAVAATLYAACWGVYLINRAKLAKEVGQTIEKSIAPTVQRGGALAPDLAEAAELIDRRGYLGAHEVITGANLDALPPERASAIRQLRTRIDSIQQQLTRAGAVWQTIFMPRYFGFVWVAFGVALTALYMRLPTAGVRMAAMGLLIGVNFGQFYGRLFAGTEPPLDHVAREVWRHDGVHNRGIAQLCLPDDVLREAQKAADAAGKSDLANLLHYALLGGDTTTRVYVNDGVVPGAGHPGYGTLQGQQGKYYLGLERGLFIHPTEWKRIDSGRYFTIMPAQDRRGGAGLNDAAIAADVKRNPDVRRVIVWEKFNSHPPIDRRDPSFNPSPTRQDELAPLLGPGWRCVHEHEYPVRFHWTWRELYVYKRFEYVKG